MFAVPSLPTSLRLVSEQEISDINGKLRSLKKVFKMPRATLPKLAVPTMQLLQCLHSLLLCGNQPYTVEARKQVEMGLKTTRYLEDLLIRVVIGEETYESVYADHMKQLFPSGKTPQSCKSNVSP